MMIFIYPKLNDSLKRQVETELGPKSNLYFNSGEADNVEMFRQSNIVFGNPPKQWFQQNVPHLKFWQLDSAGFNQYSDVSSDSLVANMGDFFSIPCAETMLGGILTYYRRINEVVKLQLEKKWVGAPLRLSTDVLTGKNVLILGAGSIANAIRKMLVGFDCSTTLMARSAKGDGIISYDAALASLSEFDLVINTLPGNANLLVSSQFIQAMKPGVLYASIGRGNTTDEVALIEALNNGTIAGAVLDVTMTEPLPITSPLWSMANVILTQHTGGGQKHEEEGKVALFIENARRFLNHKPVLNQIDIKKGY